MPHGRYIDNCSYNADSSRCLPSGFGRLIRYNIPRKLTQMAESLWCGTRGSQPVALSMKQSVAVLLAPPVNWLAILCKAETHYF
jgi:hypothetical protein